MVPWNSWCRRVESCNRVNWTQKLVYLAMKRMNLVFWCLQCVLIGICFWLDDDDGHHRTLNVKRLKLNEIPMRRLCVVYAKQHGVIERDCERRFFCDYTFAFTFTTPFVWHFRCVCVGVCTSACWLTTRLSSFHKLIGDWFVHLKIEKEKKRKKRKMKIDVLELVWVCVALRCVYRDERTVFWAKHVLMINWHFSRTRHTIKFIEQLEREEKKNLPKSMQRGLNFSTNT